MYSVPLPSRIEFALGSSHPASLRIPAFISLCFFFQIPSFIHTPLPLSYFLVFEASVLGRLASIVTLSIKHECYEEEFSCALSIL